MAKTLKIGLGSLVLQIVLSRRSRVSPGHEDAINLGYVKALETRFRELRELGFRATTANMRELGAFYAAYIPAFNPPSKGAYLRSQLLRLIRDTQDPALKAAVVRAIAISDLEDGLPDRSKILKSDSEMASVWAEVANRFDEAYGGPMVGQDWSGASRGQSLIAYFEAHPALLRGKDILHFAPEAELRIWVMANRDVLGIGRYVTADGFAPDVDEHHDITALNTPDASYDLLICHRVMEHVLDDAAGFRELHRVLRPGGLLSFSVPQSPQQAQTMEWAIPDESHDGHVRQYGLDLEARMRAAGFRVELEPWLLQQGQDVLREKGAYPMRIYHGWRDS